MFYIIDKPKGITSNQALSKFKKENDIKKAGFSGVLDPFATGLLIIATDGDTKFLDLFLGEDKTYEGTMLFGATTDTLDIDGEVIAKDDKVVSLEEVILTAEQKFTGSIMQLPPKYSNIRVDGKRAHELARKDVDFELKKVPRVIKSWEINEADTENEFTFEVEVSSGTYIRALARDMGEELGTVGMLTELRRTSIGKVDLSMVGEAKREDIVPLPFNDVTEKELIDLLNGKDVPLRDIKEDETVVTDGKRTLWIKRVGNVTFKIHKNIQ